MKIKQTIKYGTLAGASFTIGYTVGQALHVPNTSTTHRSMHYSTERAYDLLEDIDKQISTLESIGLNNEVQHLESVSDKLQSSVAEAQMMDESHVDVDLNAEEFAAWVISILGKESDSDGVGRQE